MRDCFRSPVPFPDTAQPRPERPSEHANPLRSSDFTDCGIPWHASCSRSGGGAEMSQRTVEAVIGRLVTDEGFRRRFRDNPEAVIDELIANGTLLTAVERRALVQMDAKACEQFADRVDPRLQKICLRGNIS